MRDDFESGAQNFQIRFGFQPNLEDLTNRLESTEYLFVIDLSGKLKSILTIESP